ncbi:hypothetical protein QRD43_21940 [Pelomonas sp. APW6]|uniref:TnsA endonuclease N-terminal domain-containing protein n=1 Tax=Roseateles subflavus TaxID=3053353 RepID=A0ABT7LNX7_9BURK|nr:TnsA endonuclease N-terminal domain-containing protein [Pelomonas sp. APW6]MDL5034582.1 hypothetical protein [Pelomonas sp. APW6]
MKPARQVIHRSNHRSVGSISATWFQDSPIHHESDLEAGVIKVLLMCPLVRHIQHQPTTLAYIDDDQARSHIPDLGLTLVDDVKAIVEVKPQKFVTDHVSKFNACAALLQAKQMNYYVCTDEHVTEERIARATEILDSAKRAAPNDALQALTAWVQRKRKVLVQDALAAGYREALILHAVGRRHLVTDPSLRLAPEDWLTTQETADEQLSLAAWLGSGPWPGSNQPYQQCNHTTGTPPPSEGT